MDTVTPSTLNNDCIEKQTRCDIAAQLYAELL